MIYFVSNQPSLYANSSRIQSATMLDCITYLLDKTVVGVDTETEGFNFLHKKLIMFQIGDAENQFVIDTRGISIEPLRPILESKSVLKVLHNVKFDYKFIKRWYDITLENVYDTMLAEQVIHCGKDFMGYALLDLSLRYLSKSLNKETRNKFVGLYGKPYDEMQITYGAEDVEVLLSIRDKQLAIIPTLPVDLTKVIQLENDSSLAFADIEYNGFKFNKEHWLKLASTNREELVKTKDQLDSFVAGEPKLASFVNKNVQLDAFTPVEELRTCTIKWSSPIQVLKVMQKYGLKIEAVNHNDLKPYKKDPFVAIYLKYTEQAKAVSTYGASFLDYVDTDGRIRTTFYQVLETGRVSSGSKKHGSPKKLGALN